VGIADLRRRVRDDRVAAQHQRGAEADGMAVQRHDDRGADVEQRRDEVEPFPHRADAYLGQVVHLLDQVEAAAGGEHPALGGEHDRPDVGPFRQVAEGMQQFGVGLAVDAVQEVGPAEREADDRAVVFQADRLEPWCRHAVSPRRSTRRLRSVR
jgi:hypothetical protein